MVGKDHVFLSDYLPRSFDSFLFRIRALFHVMMPFYMFQGCGESYDELNEVLLFCC